MNIEKLIKIAIENLKNSYSPYSKFKVSAVLETKEGELYTGVNIENASYPAGICAERVAIFKAISEGKKDFKRLVLIAEANNKLKIAYPCGICRQVLNEFKTNNFEIIVASSINNYKIYNIDELLPYSFGSKDMED
ncbi:cytidine deaminase [Citroniella saccharovorans]|uniref:Cytidine deaminase n=1 Tax=Citroniella saccharovorans TaxID=2053367 RepID=A0AAW9MV06_9FIRM|nr:cytidine deaminase [Citroniella saccharovorans]MEB3429444.1 cytidine deaminase [Citroniella saccharovorans]